MLTVASERSMVYCASGYGCQFSFLRNIPAQLTSAITAHTINLLILAHLEQSTVASFASTVVTTMPRSADTITLLPLLLACCSLYDGANNFVAEDQWALCQWTEFALGFTLTRQPEIRLTQQRELSPAVRRDPNGTHHKRGP